MHYYDHALLSSYKYGCTVDDTLRLHRLMDSSKFFFPASQHRMFSHNCWFIQVLTELVGDVVENSLKREFMSVRDILYEHCREDHNGHVPTPADWLQCLRFEVPEQHRKWFNSPRSSDKVLLQQIREQTKINLL
ncbi:MAG TPA: hypothetical protein VM802_06845 [Chitinophaga sp.]|uniref:DUF6915 family protein n=1 Tax=Chitinophaga sp. TaxID=1869181 RepID=UPI002C464ECB|nr:hypothetical protein [Chitinophaga sp.]HVI44567.1 hypothetical protein [Chitinophaga sp.]